MRSIQIEREARTVALIGLVFRNQHKHQMLTEKLERVEMLSRARRNARLFILVLNSRYR